MKLKRKSLRSWANETRYCRTQVQDRSFKQLCEIEVLDECKVEYEWMTRLWKDILDFKKG